MAVPTEESYQLLEEYTNGVYIPNNKTAYIQIPVSASSRSPVGLQFSVLPKANASMTLFTGDTKWALNITKHPTIQDLARFEITSGSSNAVLVSSSYQELYDNKLLNIAIKNYLNTSSFYFTYVDGEDIVFNEKLIETSKFNNLWTTTNYIHLGGSGSRVINNCDAIIDEFRLWGIPLEDKIILDTAFDPGSNAGNTYSDAAEDLYVQLSFYKIDTGSLSLNILSNESPYKEKTNSPSLDTISSFNIQETDFIRYNRIINQKNIIAGSNTFVTNKIVVVPPPKFISNSRGLRLYRDKSIVSTETKKLSRGNNKVVLAVSPTDIINQNIIRNFGLENINAIIGSPTTLYSVFEKSLNTLKKYYEQYYFVEVNSNRFVRLTSDVSSAMNQIVEYFIPSRAKLLKGILIQPNILEQPKIPIPKSVRFYGKNSRKTLNAVGSLTGSSPDYAATFNVSKNIDLSKRIVSGNNAAYSTQKDTTETLSTTGTYTRYVTEINTSENIIPTASTIQYKTEITDNFKLNASNCSAIDSLIDINHVELPTLNRSEYLTYGKQHQPIGYTGLEKDTFIDMELDNIKKINYSDENLGSPGAEPFNRLYPRKLFNIEIESPRIGGRTSIYTPALYEIPPSADFKDPGVYTYFNNEEGIYFFNETKKTPAYPSPINATWNFQNQTFGNTVNNWSYGSKYNKLDVVYQDISTEDLKNFTSTEDLKVNAGNKRYYVFKTRPAYYDPGTGEAFYSGSVPSYLPPSLDRVNWDVLRFKPVQVRVPKRVVFDTFTVGDPSLNNFKVTTISIDKNINVPNRFIDKFRLGAVDGNSYNVGELLVQNIGVLFALQSTSPGLRIRLYRTAAARDNDISRAIEVRPDAASGVLFDANINDSNVVQLTNPIPTFVADSFPPLGKIFYTVNNLDSASKISITLHVYYFAIEIEPRFPFEYLRKHYRFFRDNSTATKRRNYLGCKNTEETTIDGLPPVQIFIGEGTDVQVAQTTGNQEIVTGGGGQLNVT
jgi:hypothetical protein